jgi:hypothetical protein
LAVACLHVVLVIILAILMNPHVLIAEEEKIIIDASSIA